MFIVREGTVTRPNPSLSLKDHADQTWTVEMWGNWFVRRTTIESTKVESITADLEVTDHEGIQWIATRIGTGSLPHDADERPRKHKGLSHR